MHMKKRDILFRIILYTLLAFGMPGALYAAGAQVMGIVSDKTDHEPLVGANVYIEGTSLGSSSNMDGVYEIRNIPAGSYVLHVLFIGYKEIEKPLTLSEGQTLRLNLELEPEALETEAIVVSVQAEGQMAAINQQLSAQSIVNVVSAKQIRELPDANAAESLRRLPGVSITREGGEGNKVVIRGMAPKYNAITIDGIRMASSNKDNRGADLSMISSTMLEGIEISKTITADKDADMLGGSVNFKIREARGRQQGQLSYDLTIQNGYVPLANSNNFSTYKITPGIEGRFFEDRFGVFIQANIEKRNLTSNEFSARYSSLFNSDPSRKDYKTDALFLHNIPRERQRYNGALVLDYRLPNGKINLSNFLSSSTTEIEDRNETLLIRTGPQAANQHLYSLDYSKNTLNLIHNVLNLEQKWGDLQTALKMSHSYSETKSPNDWSVVFFQSPANLNQYEEKANLDPAVISRTVFNDPEATRLNTVQTRDNFSSDRIYMTALDMEYPFSFTPLISATLKAGLKYKKQKNSYRSEVYGTNATFTSPSARAGAQMVADYFGWNGDPNAIPLSLFLDKNYNYKEPFNGDFKMSNPMDADKAAALVKFIQDNADLFTEQSPEAFARNNYLSATHNYRGSETTEAAYLMAVIQIGNQLEIIPGIRYQNLTTEYTGARGQQTTFSYNFYNHTDTTVSRSHPFVLPSINLKYKPVNWFDLRLAYSKTLAYPDFTAIIPRIDAYGSPVIEWNNTDLVPTQSENYDINFSFSENTVGLLTLGAFLKRIRDVIYPWSFYVRGRDAQPYYLPEKKPNPRWRYNIRTYINNPFIIDNWGIEADWQTHFWYLPAPLNGLVLSVNYTHSFSRARYPFQTPAADGYTAIDSAYTDRLIYQPEDIFNMTIGYDYKDFSLRLSMLYTDDVFSYATQNEQERANTAPYQRWDLSFKQGLPWFALQLYGNLSNINYSRDKSVLQLYPATPTRIEEYGLTAELGLRWNL